MSTIRPDLSSNLPAPAAGPSAQVKAAQAAFFRAALGEVQAAQARPQAQPTAQTTQTTQAESPRLPRLGQHLDIRV